MKGPETQDLTRLWTQTADKVRAYMFCGCRNWPDADDLAQECFLRAMRGWNSFNGTGSRAAWLFGVARNTRIDWLRLKRRRQERVAPPDRAAPSADTVVSRSDQAETIWTAANALPAEQSDVLHLRFAAGLSYAEIADATAVPIGTVRSRLHRALKVIREQVRGLEDEP